MNLSSRSFLYQTLLLILLIAITACSCSSGISTPTLGSQYEFIPSYIGTTAIIITASSTSTSISISWTPATNANFYEIYRSLTSDGTYEQIGENNINSYTDSSVSPGTFYYYKIKSGWRSSVNLTNIIYGSLSNWHKSNTILDAPQSVSASEDNTTLVSVQWLAVQGASSYKIFRAPNSSSIYTLLKSDHTGTSYDDTTATVGDIYKYQISAISSSAIESVKSNYDTGYKCADSPTGLSVSEGLYFSVVKLSWNAAPNSPYRYQIYRSLNGGEYLYYATTPNSIPNYSDTSVSFGNNYSYKVRAEYASGSFSLISSSSVNGYVRNPSDTVEYTVSWAQNREAAVNRSGGGYKLYFSQADNFDINVATSIDLPYSSGAHAPTSTTISLPCGTWYLKVVAYSSMNSVSTSIPSNQASVIIE